MTLYSRFFSVWFCNHRLPSPSSMADQFDQPIFLFLLAGCFTSLASNVLALVLNALALINFRWALVAYESSQVAYCLFVRTSDSDDVAFADRDSGALGRLNFNRVRIAKLHNELGAFHLGTITDADDF